MKSLILFSLFVLFAAPICTKDKKKTTVKPVPELLKGTWFTISDNIVYFDSANNKVFETNNTPNSKYVINDKISRTDSTVRSNLSTSYTATYVNGKNFITFTDNGSAQTFEILQVDTKVMAWQLEKTNQMYNDNGQKTAAKMVYTINFKCPCRE